MKKLFMLGIATIIIFLSVLGITDQALADEEKIKVVFEMTTPEEFKEEIRVKTRNLETNKKYSFSIASGADYSSFLKIPPGDYSLEVEFKEGSLYTSNAQETYSFRSDGQVVTFDIFLQEGVQIPEQIVDNVGVPQDSNVPVEEIYVEVKHPLYVYNEFLEKISYIEDDEYMNGPKGLFNKSSSSKDLFLQDHQSHTEEIFDNMTGYEVYLWEMSIFWPKIGLRESPYSLEKYLETNRLALMKKKFVDKVNPGYEGKEAAYYAIEEVWRWYFDYYQKTGEVFIFEDQEWFSIDNIAFMQEPSLWTDSDVMKVKLNVTEEMTLEDAQMLEQSMEDTTLVVTEEASAETIESDVDEEQDIIDEASNNPDEEKKTIFGLLRDWFAKNIFTTILIIVLCVVCVILFFRNKKKNS